MPDREREGSRSNGGVRRTSRLVLALALAALAALLVSGVVMADGWPPGPGNGSGHAVAAR